MTFSPFRRTSSATLATVVLLVSHPTLGQARANSGQREQTDRKAIDALSQKDIAACMRQDVEALCSLWTDDGVLLMPGAPPLNGKNAICGMLKQQKAQSSGSIILGYTEDWDEVRTVGDYAWQWGKMSQTQKSASGKEETARFNAIRILRREADGTWRVARAAITPAP